MLRDSFYRYGIISNILHDLIIVLVIGMYISSGLNQFGESTVFQRAYLSFIFILFFVLLFKSIWRLFNKAPMSSALTKVGKFIRKFNLLLMYIALFALVASDFIYFIFDAYSNYEVDVNNKTDYTVFGVVVIPFSIIQLVCYILTHYMHVDIMYFKYVLKHYSNLIILYIFPLLAVLYVLQKLLNYYIVRKTGKPEKLT